MLYVPWDWSLVQNLQNLLVARVAAQPFSSMYLLAGIGEARNRDLSHHRRTLWAMPAQLESSICCLSKHKQHFLVAFLPNWNLIFFTLRFNLLYFFSSVLKSTQATHISRRKRNTTTCSSKIWELGEVWNITIFTIDNWHRETDKRGFHSSCLIRRIHQKRNYKETNGQRLDQWLNPGHLLSCQPL